MRDHNAKPRISVTMAICNIERFLAEAIESVLVQTFRDFELIIVDFGSTDSSRSIVASYASKDDRIRTIDAADCDLVRARNVACSYARGELIAVMDADDVCLPMRFEREIEVFEGNHNIGMVGSATQWIDASGEKLGVQYVPETDDEIRATLPIRCPFWHPTVMVRTSILKSVGWYRSPFVYAHDYDMELRIAEHCRCENLAEVLVNYRVHSSQVTLKKREQQTICKLAAQASARRRAAGRDDPLNNAQEITPGLLAELGVSDRELQNTLVSDGRNWIRAMIAAGEDTAALGAAAEIVKSAPAGVERWQIADLLLTIAKLHWKGGNVMKSAAAASRAIARRPVIVARPLKAALGSASPRLTSRNR